MKCFHQRVGVLRENLSGRRDNTVDACAAEFILRRILFQKTENLAHKIVQIFFFFLLKNKFQRIIDFPHGADMDIPEPRNRHDSEEKIQFNQVTALIGFRFFQRVGHMQVAVDDLEIIRQGKKVPDMRSRFLAVLGTKRFEFQNQFAEMMMTERLDQFQISLLVQRRVGLAFSDEP